LSRRIVKYERYNYTRSINTVVHPADEPMAQWWGLLSGAGMVWVQARSIQVSCNRVFLIFFAASSATMFKMLCPFRV